MRREGLDADEPRELYPAALILEDVAITGAARFGAEQLAEMRHANARLRATAGDAAAAAAADDDFHRRLVEPHADGRLKELHGAVRRKIQRYEQAALRSAARARRRAAEHDLIVSALERGDRGAAVRRVRAHWTRALDELTAELEGA